jgi:Tol biopolymer transport system component
VSNYFARMLKALLASGHAASEDPRAQGRELEPGTSGRVGDPNARIQLRAKEASLGRLPPGTLLDTILASPDGTRVSYAATRGRKWSVTLDGKAIGREYDIPLGPEYAALTPEQQEQVWQKIEADAETLQQLAQFISPRFSPDSRRLAYVGCSQAAEQVFPLLGVPGPVKQRVVLDGAEGEKYDRIVTGSVVFSPDSRRLAYAAQRAGRFLVVVDHLESDEFEDIRNPVFSPDSRKVAFVAGKVGHRVGIVDGVAVTRNYPDVGGGTGMVFSPDSARLAYVACGSGKETVVLDGVEVGTYDSVGQLHFSPDGRSVLYTAWRNQKPRAVLNDVEGETYDAIGTFRPPFSLDSKRIAYAAVRAGKEFVVVDEKEHGPYDGISSCYFSPDSQHVAYKATQGGKEFVVVDGKAGARYDNVGMLTFSPDSKHLAYLARRGEARFAVVDEFESESQPGFPVPAEHLIFTGPNAFQSLITRRHKKGIELVRAEVEIVEKRAGD